MTETIQKLIDRWSLKPADYEPALPCPHFYRGFTMRDYVQVDAPGFRYQDTWSTGYREVFVNETERAIFTYCEGDLDLTVDDDEDTFRRRLASADQFYREVATK